ncbi:MAG: hypothetical protein QOE46_616, partial [Acidobacteriota bacterium]|nr:hypothetical protein [Acidobacteriota bacterium]
MKNLRRLLLTSLLITAFAAAAPLLSSIAEAAAVGGVSTSSQPRAAAVENHDDKSADWGLFVAPFDFSGGTSAPRPGVYGAYAASMMRAMLFAPMTFAVTNTNDSGT